MCQYTSLLTEHFDFSPSVSHLFVVVHESVNSNSNETGFKFRWTLDMDSILQSKCRSHRWSRQLYFPRKILHQERLNLIVEGNIKVIWS